MRSLQGALIAMGAVLGTGLLSALVIAGCGDDTSGAAPDSGGGDSTADVAADNQQADSPGPDSADGPSAEAGDAGNDAADAGDALSADAGDAQDASAIVAAIAAYKEQLATARCNNWQPCCPVDGGPYDRNACIGAFENYGWEGNLPYTQLALGRGNVQFDMTKAAQCVAAVGSIPCGTQTAAQWTAVTQACTGVLQGTLPIGQSGCVGSVECVPGSYCSYASGTGVCTALATMGQPCNPNVLVPSDAGVTNFPNPRADEICSYLASSNTGLYCDLIDPVGSANYQTCQPLIAAGGNCVNGTNFYYDDQACPATGALCGDNNQCGGSASYPYAGGGECSWVVQDAGGGG